MIYAWFLLTTRRFLRTASRHTAERQSFNVDSLSELNGIAKESFLAWSYPQICIAIDVLLLLPCSFSLPCWQKAFPESHNSRMQPTLPSSPLPLDTDGLE